MQQLHQMVWLHRLHQLLTVPGSRHSCAVVLHVAMNHGAATDTAAPRRGGRCSMVQAASSHQVRLILNTVHAARAGAAAAVPELAPLPDAVNRIRHGRAGYARRVLGCL
jgi:hypothetical protein